MKPYRKTRARRGRAIGVLAGVVCLVSVMLVPKPAGASEVWWRYVQFNLYGYAYHDGNLAPAQWLYLHAYNRISQGLAPVAISIQEVCGSDTQVRQAEYISNALQQYGYETHFMHLANTDNVVDCPKFGIALSIFTASPSVRYHELLPEYGLTSLENRGVLCAVGYLWGLGHSACSTHVTASSAVPPGQGQAINQLQAEYVVHMSNNYNISNPVSGRYLGGDFNLPYNTMHSPTVISPNAYTLRYEANDFALQVYHTWNLRYHSPLDKADYAFAAKSLHDFATIAVFDYWDSTYQISDHGLVEGNFRQA